MPNGSDMESFSTHKLSEEKSVQIFWHKLLGAGAEGRVLEGVLVEQRADGETRMEVAVKVTRGGCESLETMQHEAECLARLPDHVNVIRYHGSTVELIGHGIYEGIVVMEKMEGDLARFIFAPGRQQYRYADLIQIAEGITTGVEHLHRNGVFHFDIKPDNIMMSKLSADGVPKIADFGASKVQEGPGRSITATLRGTQGYRAPEVELGGMEQVHPRSRNKSIRVDDTLDTYSLGVIFLQLFEKVDVGEAATPEDVQEGNYIRLGGVQDVLVRCTIRKDLARLIEECLRFDLKKFMNGRRDYGRPTCAQIVSRLRRMKHASWATDPVPNYSQVKETMVNPDDATHAPRADYLCCSFS